MEQEDAAEAGALETDVAGELVGVEGAEQLGEVDEGALEALVDRLARGERVELAERLGIGVAVDRGRLGRGAGRRDADGGDGGLGHHGVSRRDRRR